uniref:Ig-like domain-containing protein n=1 Tax=Varanus komodoensis TaxID=61221 RepID=A0A8D2Q3A2_VARKO
KAPSLSLVFPSPAKLMQPTSQDVALLACEISGFFPVEILISWKKNNITFNSLYSQETVSCTHKFCFCNQKINHFISGFLEPASPKVMVFHTSEDGECQKLVCFATNFYPQNINIQWSIQGHNLSCSSESSSSLSLTDGTFQKNCSLVLRGEECKKQEMYTCAVTHSSTNTFIKKTVPSCGKSKRAGKLCMPLVNATSNSIINWTMDGKPADMNRILELVGHFWLTGSWFWIMLYLSFGHLPVFSNTGIMKAPEVYLQQSSKEGMNVTLVCMARNFYPAEIFLKWEEEDKERSLKSYEAHDLNCNHEEQRCSLVSILEVPTSKWMMGVSYTCLVVHISSENIITRRANIFSDSTFYGDSMHQRHSRKWC